MSLWVPVDDKIFSKTGRRVMPGSNLGWACRPSCSEFSTKFLYVLLFGLLRNSHKYGLETFRLTLHGRQSPYSLMSLVIQLNLYLESAKPIIYQWYCSSFAGIARAYNVKNNSCLPFMYLRYRYSIICI